MSRLGFGLRRRVRRRRRRAAPARCPCGRSSRSRTSPKGPAIDGTLDRRSVEIREARRARMGSAPQGGAVAADRRLRAQRRPGAVRRVRREADSARSSRTSTPTTSASTPTTRCRSICGRAARRVFATSSPRRRWARTTSTPARTRPTRRNGRASASCGRAASPSRCASRSASCAVTGAPTGRSSSCGSCRRPTTCKCGRSRKASPTTTTSCTPER